VNDPFKDLLDSLAIEESSEQAGDDSACIDPHRENRKGVPEVVLAEGKSEEHVLCITRSFLDRCGRAILSRVNPGLMIRLRSEFGGYQLEAYDTSGMVVIRVPGTERVRTGGKLGVISAGTSDIRVAEEAVVLAAEMGCEVTTIYDVGVAGIHRLFRPLRTMLQQPVDVIVVAAGMDGALPSVVAGLVDVPVIGLPTSVGYGHGGRGEAALMSMLQTCAPGLTVVNIDNGIGAGATAALIANRMAKARERTVRD
jgi:pyridinium-3,5-biscarboxylic acid mononucleotide synthase